MMCLMLTLEDVAWMSEIAASVVRNNCVARAPRDWRQIPMWWEAVGVAGVGEEEMVADVVRAVGLLERLSSVPRGS